MEKRLVIIFLITLILLISFVSADIFSDVWKKVTGRTVEQLCSDTDEGKDYSIKGTCYDSSGYYLDSCSGSFVLNERYCSSGDSCVFSSDDCKSLGSNYICQNGACVKNESSEEDEENEIINETYKCVNCSSLGYECGYYSDNCGGTLNCGSCPEKDKCQDGICVEEEQEELCDYTYLDSGGTKIYLGDSINKVKSVFTKSHFPIILEDGRFFGNVEVQYTQVIHLGSYPKIEYSKAPTSSDEEEYNIKLSTSSSNYLYNETITFSKAIDMGSKNSRGEEIKLFGKDYRIGMGSTENLILLEDSEKLILDNDNPTAKISIDGKYYTIELISGSDMFALIKVTDSNGNSDAKQVSEDEIKIINGLLVGVNDVAETNLGVFAILIVGSRSTKLTLEDGSAVTIGEDDSIIDGTLVDFGIGNPTNLTRLTISIYAPESDKDAIRLEESFTDPVFGTLEMFFESYDDINGAKIKLIGCVEEGQCIPNYFCVVEPATCPSSGVQTKKCVDIKCGTEGYEEEIICNPGMCTGCKLDKKCIPYGFRIKFEEEKLYCDIDNELKEQKTIDADGNLAECQNNYECESNVCSSGECVEIKKMLKEANKFKSFVVKALCKIIHLFNTDKYNRCVYNFLGENVLSPDSGGASR